MSTPCCHRCCHGISLRDALTESLAKLITVIVYAVVDDALSLDFPLGDALEVFVRREDAERFIEEVRGDEPEMAAKPRIEEPNSTTRRCWREREVVGRAIPEAWATI